MNEIIQQVASQYGVQCKRVILESQRNFKGFYALQEYETAMNSYKGLWINLKVTGSSLIKKGIEWALVQVNWWWIGFVACSGAWETLKQGKKYIYFLYFSLLRNKKKFLVNW